MADVLREPIYVTRSELPVQTAVIFVALSSLLTTTLAVSPLPVGAQSFPVQVERYVSINADTCRGTPVVLQSIPAPVVVAPNLGPQRYPWLPADTTQDSPQTLRPDAQAPVANLQHTAPDRARVLPANSSAGVPKTLVTDAQAL